MFRSISTKLRFLKVKALPLREKKKSHRPVSLALMEISEN